VFHFLEFVSIQAAFSGGFARTAGASLPLPAGEGRGEGEAWPSNLDFENTPRYLRSAPVFGRSINQTAERSKQPRTDSQESIAVAGVGHAPHFENTPYELFAASMSCQNFGFS
jgi:hypothetical protein